MMDFKLIRNIVLSYIGFFTLVMSGFVIYYSITYWQGPVSLSVFNKLYVTYLLVSQIATLGIQFSVLRESALINDDQKKLGELVGSACLIALLYGGTWSLALYLSSSLFQHYLQIKLPFDPIQYCCLGVLFFPLNKVLQAYLNGRQRMGTYSFVQAVKYIALTIMIITLVATNKSIGYAPIGFFMSEILSLMAALYFLNKSCLISCLKISIDQLHKIFHFGIKSYIFSLVSENYSKILLLVYSCLLSELFFGIFSFVMLFIDGFLAFIAVLRANYNPRLVLALNKGNNGSLKALLCKSQKFFLPLIFLFSIGVAVVFSVCCHFLQARIQFDHINIVLYLMLTAIIMLSPYMLFSNIFITAGRPKIQALQQLTALFFYIFFAVLLIPHYQLMGAATSFMLGYVFECLLLMLFSFRFFRWNLLTNSFYGAS